MPQEQLYKTSYSPRPQVEHTPTMLHMPEAATDIEPMVQDHSGDPPNLSLTRHSVTIPIFLGDGL